jgi:hypothetical protein
MYSTHLMFLLLVAHIYNRKVDLTIWPFIIKYSGWIGLMEIDSYPTYSTNMYMANPHLIPRFGYKRPTSQVAI